MNTPTPKAQIEQRIIAKAMKDEQFRNQLINTPREAIEAELGVVIPASLQIKVLQENPQSVYLVLPQPAAAATDELSELELESVAGGFNIWSEGTDCGSCETGTCCYP